MSQYSVFSFRFCKTEMHIKVASKIGKSHLTRRSGAWNLKTLTTCRERKIVFYDYSACAPKVHTSYIEFVFHSLLFLGPLENTVDHFWLMCHQVNFKTSFELYIYFCILHNVYLSNKKRQLLLISIIRVSFDLAKK